MNINKQQTEKILAIMERFPAAKSYRLKADTGSGIGTKLQLVVDTNLDEFNVEVLVDLSSTETW